MGVFQLQAEWGFHGPMVCEGEKEEGKGSEEKRERKKEKEEEEKNDNNAFMRSRFSRLFLLVVFALSPTHSTRA